MAIVVPANEEGRKFYEQAEVKPAKWLMPDGSIVDEFPMAGGGSDVKLQDNKEVSITENGEIEITPDQGYDAVKKITASVNVPAAGVDCKYEYPGYGSSSFIFTDKEFSQEGGTVSGFMYLDGAGYFSFVDYPYEYRQPSGQSITLFVIEYDGNDYGFYADSSPVTPIE